MNTTHQYLHPEYLRKITMFSSLSDAELTRIIKSPGNSVEEYNNKDIIFHEDEIGECMYIILDGTVDIFIKGSLDYRDAAIATLREGDYFGENAVLTDGPVRRSASARAESLVRVYRIEKKNVRHAINRVHGIVEISARFPPDEIRDAIMKMPLFKSLAYDELLTIREWASIETCAKGDLIIQHGAAAEYVLIILEGQVELYTPDKDGNLAFFETRKAVDYLGVTPFLPGQNGTYNFSVTSSSPSRLIKIPKEYFLAVLARDKKVAHYLKEICIVKKMKLENMLRDTPLKDA